jgi:hypothetical protein
MQEEGSAVVSSEIIVSRIKLISRSYVTDNEILPSQNKINVIFSYELCTELGFTQHTVMKISTMTGYDERN